MNNNEISIGIGFEFIKCQFDSIFIYYYIITTIHSNNSISNYFVKNMLEIIIFR